MVSLCLPHHKELIDIQHDLVGPLHVLDLGSSFDLSFQGRRAYISKRLDERNRMASISLASFEVFFCENHFCQILLHLLTSSSYYMEIRSILMTFPQRAVQDLSITFFRGLLPSTFLR